MTYEMAEALKIAAKAKGMSQADYYRQAIQEALDGNDEKGNESKTRKDSPKYQQVNGLYLR